MDTRPPLKVALGETSWWHKVPGGVSPSKNLVGSDNPDVFYTLEEFGAVNPRLVDLFEHMFSDDDCMSGRSLRQILDFWDNDAIRIPRVDLAVREKLGDHAIKHFVSFTWESGSRNVLVYAWQYPLLLTKSGTVYPASPEPGYIHVPKDWLDEHFPKWQERYLIAKSLELTNGALTELIISNADADTSVSIDSVSFP